MCPACIATVALIAISATSTGGLTALVVKKFRTTAGAKKNEPAIRIQGEQYGSIPSSEEYDESSQRWLSI